MHILLVAATSFEIQPITDYLQSNILPQHRVEVLITGVGMLQTGYVLTRRLCTSRFDLLLQAGIGGSFSRSLSPGQVVLVEREVIGDLGVEEQGRFRDVVDMGFAGADVLPYRGGWLVNSGIDRWGWLGLPLVAGNTINEVTTRPARIADLEQKYGVHVESMEGAAFHYVALQEGIPFLQLRAVSNYVGERDKSKWRLQEAIAALNEQLKIIIEGL